MVPRLQATTPHKGRIPQSIIMHPYRCGIERYTINMRKLKTIDFEQYPPFSTNDCPHIGCAIAISLEPPRFNDIWNIVFYKAWRSYRNKSILALFGGSQNHQFSDVVTKIPIHATHYDLLFWDFGGEPNRFGNSTNGRQSDKCGEEIPSIHAPRISYVKRSRNLLYFQKFIKVNTYMKGVSLYDRKDYRKRTYDSIQYLPYNMGAEIRTTLHCPYDTSEDKGASD
jgi:hypothetical protein